MFDRFVVSTSNDASTSTTARARNGNENGTSKAKLSEQ